MLLKTRSFSFASLFAALLLAGPVSAKIERNVHRTFSVDPGGLAYLSTQGGDIVVTSGAVDTVEVHARLIFPRADSEAEADRIMDQLDLSMTEDERGVRVTTQRVKGESGWFNWRSSNRVSVDLNVVVPSEYDVEARTSGGDIEISDLSGDVLARTSGGDIEVGHIDGPVNISTSGGDIEVAYAYGPVKASTSGGDVHVREAEGSVNASTSGGDIRIGRVEGELKASTSGGDITARIQGELTKDALLSTSGGDVTAWVEEGISFDLDARTSGGSVRADGITIRIDQGGVGKSKLVGEVNGGGPELKLRTSGGSVRVKTS